MRKLFEDIMTGLQGMVAFAMAMFILAIMYAPIIFGAVAIISLFVPKSSKVKFGDIAFILTVFAGILNFLIALISGFEALPLWEFLNEEALKGSFFIYAYTAFGIATLIGGRGFMNKY